MEEKSTFEAQDPEYQRRVQDSFARQGLMKHLGAELVSLRAGGAEIRVPFRTERLRLCGLYVDGGGRFGAHRGVQDEFVGARGGGRDGGQGARGEGGEDVDDLYGGCVCSSGRGGNALCDNVGDDYVFGGEVGWAAVGRSKSKKQEARSKKQEARDSLRSTPGQVGAQCIAPLQTCEFLGFAENAD
jgi:hypothetical protein